MSYRWNTGIRSSGVDRTWTMKSKYCDPQKFQFVTEYLFNEEFLEIMFRTKSQITEREFVKAFESKNKMFTWKEVKTLEWVFNFAKTRKMYRASIDEGLGDKEIPIELNEYKQVTTLRRLHTMAKGNQHLRREIFMKGTKSFNDGSIKLFLN